MATKMGKRVCPLRKTPLEISGKERRALIRGTMHGGSCRCISCHVWWTLLGPDESGGYGPFKAEEIRGNVPHPREKGSGS
jgi:hypothetical protein